MRIALTALAALALAAGTVACGEKEEPEPAPPVTAATGGGGDAGASGGGQQSGGGAGGRTSEQEIEAAVETVLGGGDPAAACSDLVTPHYVEVAYGDEQGCRAAVEKQGKFAVAVTEVEIAGDTARARAEPAGGPNKGETIRVVLLNQDGAWRVSGALSNAPAGP
jgi:hypothetical protein